MSDVYARVMRQQTLLLDGGKCLAYFDYVILCSLVDLGVLICEKIQDIPGQSAVSGSELVDDKVLIGEVF
jgi:hypothetical protein